MLSSCFGLRKERADPEREPLLPQYAQDTSLQGEVYQKLHSYQMGRALTQGFMPSTEQTIINLRTLLASDFLNPDGRNLSDSGHKLISLLKQWLEQFISLLQHKNSDDQLQNIIWFFSQGHINLDTADLSSRVDTARSQANADAAYQSLRTLTSLFLTNSNFRLFLEDLNTVGREIFRDSAFALSDAAQQAGEQLEPTQEEQHKAKNAVAAHGDGDVPSPHALQEELKDAGEVLAERTGEVAQAAAESADDRLSGDEGQALLSRLKQTIASLRRRNDYATSVSAISLLIKRYARAYSRAAENVVEAAEDDIDENKELDIALAKLWGFIQGFGDKEEWQKCEAILKQIVAHQKHDPEFESFIQEVGDSLQRLLTDPEFFANVDTKFRELRDKSKAVGKESNLRQDVDKLLGQLSTTLRTASQDYDLRNLTHSSVRLFQLVFPSKERNWINSDLPHDALHTFLPLAVAAIQHIPIPRVETSTPGLDLLLENLILEPGRSTMNRSSFLPHRVRLETYNDVDIRAVRPEARDARSDTLIGGNPATAQATHRVAIRLDGLTVAARDVGFWLRTRGGPLAFLLPFSGGRLADEGLASVYLDGRGVDVRVEVDVASSSNNARDRVVSLRHVRVRVREFDYELKQTKLSLLLGWLTRPFLRMALRRLLERKMAAQIADALGELNRELVLARERLRAARAYAEEEWDIWGFVKAILARGSGGGGQDADAWTRVGVDEPGRGVFRGVYAPGSVVKLWHEEAERARERVGEFAADGWRNKVFDVPVREVSGGGNRTNGNVAS